MQKTNLKTNVVRLFSCLTILMLGATKANALDAPDFPFSENMSVTLVAEEMVVNGLPMRAYQFHSEKSVDELVEYYAGIWPDMADVVFGDWRILSHREGGNLFTVQFEGVDSQKTHGLLGISPMFDLLEESNSELDRKAKSIGRGFSLPRNSEIINDIEADDLGKKSRTIVFRNKLSVNRNYDYFSSRYKSKGWIDLLTSTQATQNSKLGALSMNKNGQEINISFSRNEGYTYGVAVHVK